MNDPKNKKDYNEKVQQEQKDGERGKKRKYYVYLSPWRGRIRKMEIG